MLKKKLGINAIEREWNPICNPYKYYKIPTTLIIPEGVKEIGRFAFYRCERLREVVIPGSVKKIGDWAFKDCEDVEIKLEKLKKSRLIERFAFASCKKLMRE